MKKVSLLDFKIQCISKCSKIKNTACMMIISSMAMTSCVVDDKSCSDSNSGDPLGDSGEIGVTADPTDLTTVNDSGDPSGEGLACADAD